MKKKEIILGIDPGTRVTGYAFLDASSSLLVPIDFGCIRPPPSIPLQKRYLIIFESLQNLVKRYDPTAIAVESQFVKKNVQSTLKLGMAKGVVFLISAIFDIPLAEYAPKEAKLAVVGYGGASKTQVQKMLQMILKLAQPPTPEDASDALALALCHAHVLQQKRRIPCLNT